ncbi:MAG: hypothetical protein V7641_5051 [Blastocatellia bacterium]
MMKRFIKRLSGVPPQVAIILVLIGIIGAAGAILLFKHTEPKTDAQVLPRAARLERMDGNVDVAQALNQASNEQLSWQDATVNAPLTVGQRVFARDNSHAEIAFSGRNYARLNPGTALDVLSLADQRTQLALRSGSAIFDVGDLTNGELYEVATPCGAVDFTEPGLYQLGIGDDGNTTISVLSGLAQVVGLAGSGEISKGEVLTLASQVAAQAVMAKLAPDTAGNILDDYYGYRYPHKYDGRYRNYDTYLDNPDYYDAYSQSTSYQYVAEDVPGLYDLDEYGDWQDVNGYGRCWAPRVEADWSPYRQGYWDVNDVWGPTWISSEPWGYAPYHYGRWAYANQQRWVWVPEDCRTNPVYAPALVAFVPIQQSQIAWVPLAPGERYVPRYYDASFEPRYLASPQIVEEYVNVQRTYVNMNYTTGVTVVPVQAFTRRIDRNVIVPTNPQWMQQAQAVSDPYAVAGVRQVAMQEERAQRKQARREMQAAMFNRPVVTSVAPVVPGQANPAQALQYQSVTEKQKRNKLQVEQSGQVVAAQRADGVPLAGQQAAQQAMAQQRDQRIAELRTRLQQGDRSAKQELRQLKRERQEQPAAVQAPQQAMTPKQQRRFERQQQPAAQQAATQQQAVTQKQQRRLERQQQAAAQQTQVNQQREQRRTQKQAERQQVMQQQQAQRATQQQQVESRRQQKQQPRQQQAVQHQAAQQSQVKAQRRAERQQQSMQQQQRQAAAQAQMNQQRQQMRAQRQQQAMQQQQAAQSQIKAQRRAERQQQQQQVMVQQQRQQRQQQGMQQQQQMRQQEKQQRRVERQQQAAPRPPAMMGPPVPQQSKAERKAARRNP